VETISSEGGRQSEHDLRQPLARLGALIATARQYPDLPLQSRGCLEQMEAQVHDLADMYSRLADRLKAGPPPAPSLELPPLDFVAWDHRDGVDRRTGRERRRAADAGPRTIRPGSITLVICDDHRMFGESLGAMLEARGHTVMACTSDPSVAVAEVAARRPDILVTDLLFPGANGIDGVDAIGAALSASPRTRAVVLSGSGDDEWFARAERAGAMACLVKQRDIARILDAIDAVAAGHQVFDRPARRTPGRGDGSHDLLRYLTGRERQVLERLVRGQLTATIAVEMGMAHSTARSHIQKVLSKLGVHSRLEAVSLVTAGGRRKP